GAKPDDAPPSGGPSPTASTTSSAPPTQAAAVPQLSRPPAPVPAGLPAPIAASWKDPFSGGPPPKPKVTPPPPPPEGKVFDLPPIAATPHRLRRGSGWRPGGAATGGAGMTERPREAPIGRHAGWVYNNNGQIWAIFEDSTGAARAVRVGDEISGYRVKAIAQDYLVLTDADGRDQTLKLQGLDTYPGKMPGVTIDAAPGAAPADGGPVWGVQ
ncbi:MAG TPA: hypothetical protein PK794_09870, partial [Armatimonadota bacterium]|nr:hypothetical protein [Armatimonadota bacterium]